MTPPVDLTSQDFFRDPATVVRRLREAGPVVEVRFPLIGRVWMTTTQEMASRVLKDSKLFTLRKDDGAVTGLRWWMPSVRSPTIWPAASLRKEVRPTSSSDMRDSCPFG